MTLQCIQHFLQVLRYAHLRETIQVAYVSNSDSSNALEVPSGALGVDNAAPSPSSVDPYVRPVKAALYFDSVQGFGEWRIIISTAADADLRRIRKKSPDLFRITLKKIK